MRRDIRVHPPAKGQSKADNGANNGKIMIWKQLFLIFTLIATAGVGMPFVIDADGRSPRIGEQTRGQDGEDVDRQTVLKQFSPDEFESHFYSVSLPHLQPLAEEPVITGSEHADDRIHRIAQGRGYRLQRQAVQAALVLRDGELLQEDAANALDTLIAEAHKDGIALDVISGFRSVAAQRDLFLSRFNYMAEAQRGEAYTRDEIADGAADEILNAVMDVTAPPGYSKHHTGYAVDVRDAGSRKSYMQFGETAGYTWLSAENFRRAKVYGFIPSYPQGADQGPEPESWEYVWVGRGSLTR